MLKCNVIITNTFISITRGGNEREQVIENASQIADARTREVRESDLFMCDTRALAYATRFVYDMCNSKHVTVLCSTIPAVLNT